MRRGNPNNISNCKLLKIDEFYIKTYKNTVRAVNEVEYTDRDWKHGRLKFSKLLKWTFLPTGSVTPAILLLDCLKMVNGYYLIF